MIRWKESQTKTHVAGQHLCLSHIWSKRNDYTDCCPYFRAGGFHRSYRTSRLFLRSPVKGCFANQLQVHRGLHSDSWDSQQTLQIHLCVEIIKNKRRNYRRAANISFSPRRTSSQRTATNPLPARPVLWFLIKDHSCDLLNPLTVFHPGRRDLPLQKGTALSWQGWKGGFWCAACHLSVHTFCDQRQKAWGTEPSRTKRGGRGLQSRRLWGNKVSPHRLITLNKSGINIW